jgi:hypothetical protein
MMAHDEWLAPEPRALTPATLDLLRDAVWRAWRAWHVPASSAPGTGEDVSGLGTAVGAVAAEAHARGLRAEELVIAFKAVLDELAERDSGPAGPGARGFQSRLVTQCIKAYYGA